MKDVLSQAALKTALMLVFTLGFGSVAKSEESSAEPPLEQSEAASKTGYSRKLICTYEAAIGSNIKKKTCRTQQQIDYERAAGRNMIYDVSRFPGGRRPGEGGNGG
jgi:hypothetical protein